MVKKIIPRGKDFYLEKVTNFLISSIFLALASQQLFFYVYLHDYVNGFMDNNTTMFNGLIEGNNFTYLCYFIGRTLGYLLSAMFLTVPMQEDEEFGRKVFTMCLLLSSASIFIATKLLYLKDFGLFCAFYVLLPSIITCSLK